MEITSTAVGRLKANAYLLVADGQALLIDAGAEPDALADLIGDADVRTIVTTHRHDDHIGALTELWTRTKARLVAGELDAAAIEDATGVRLDDRVWDGDVVRLGSIELDVIGLVGHTPGSIALAYSPADGPTQLFTGDSLFPGGVGKTASPADFDLLLGDVTAKLFDRYDDDTIVHPGHGEPTTLGAERPHLDEWRARRW